MNQPFKFFPRQFYDGILLTALFFASNRHILAFENILADFILWGLLSICALLLLVQSGKMLEYWRAWKANWMLGLFVIYSMISVFWSISVDRSLHSVYIMVATSLIGTILAVIYSPDQLLKIILRFTVLVGILSLILVIVYPKIGIHQDLVWYGAWKGIFGHKNDFGPLMALGNGLSLNAFVLSPGKQDKLINAFSYLLTLFLVVMSRCATALALWVILNGLVMIYFAWTKWHSRLNSKNSVYVAGSLAAVSLLGFLSLIVVTRLMSKDLNLTGRLPLWKTLLKNVVSRRPWLGYGLETLWHFPEFQRWASKTSGWGDVIVVLSGHSGYMDVLLYLGIVGLLLLIIILAQGFLRAMKRALIECSWLDLFPLLIFVYFLAVNITTSFIFNFESFHWLILVILLFLPLGKLTKQLL